MRLLNPYNMTLDINGKLDILFLPLDIVEIAYFEPITILRKYFNPSSSDLSRALAECHSAYARLIYSEPSKLHYHIPVNALTGPNFSATVAENCVWYYRNLERIMYFQTSVVFMDNKGERVKERDVSGGADFLNLAIKGVI